eukprot:gene9512-6679_t
MKKKRCIHLLPLSLTHSVFFLFKFVLTVLFIDFLPQTAYLSNLAPPRPAPLSLSLREWESCAAWTLTDTDIQNNNNNNNQTPYVLLFHFHCIYLYLSLWYRAVFRFSFLFFLFGQLPQRGDHNRKKQTKQQQQQQKKKVAEEGDGQQPALDFKTRVLSSTGGCIVHIFLNLFVVEGMSATTPEY